MENAEINNIIKIVGLQYKEKYTSMESMLKLRYGRLMIMTDQDQDGSHIKGLIINFIHHNWPDLLRQNFLEEFITPLVKVLLDMLIVVNVNLMQIFVNMLIILNQQCDYIKAPV